MKKNCRAFFIGASIAGGFLTTFLFIEPPLHGSGFLRDGGCPPCNGLRARHGNLFAPIPNEQRHLLIGPGIGEDAVAQVRVGLFERGIANLLADGDLQMLPDRLHLLRCEQILYASSCSFL